MALDSFADLYDRADALRLRIPVAVAGGADPTVLAAVRSAVDRAWIAATLVGAADEIRALATANGIPLDDIQVIDAVDSAATAATAVRLACTTPGCLLMKGQLATPALMKAVLDPAAGLRTERVICQVVLMELLDTCRRFLLADTGICIQPTLPQQIDILHSAVDLAQRLGVAEPHVACMAASESTSPAMPETLQAAELQRRNQSGEIAGCVVRGPLSFDLAFDADAAARKRLLDPRFGVADILLFPNLVSANLTVKAIMYTARCRFGGVLCGAACPVVFMSRADTTETRLNSLALAMLLRPERPPAGGRGMVPHPPAGGC
jgi:phosphate butyryltransferase